MIATKRVINYLYKTRNYAIKYSGNNLRIQIFKVSSNTIFTNNINSRKSLHKYLIQLFKNQ